MIPMPSRHGYPCVALEWYDLTSMRGLPLHEKLAGLVRIGIALYSVRELDELLEMIVEEAMDICGADGGTLYLVRDSMLEFHITRNRSLEKEIGRERMLDFFERLVIPISTSSMAGTCALTGKAMNIPDLYSLPSDFPFRHNPELDRRTGYKSVSQLTVPMHGRTGGCVGVLQILNSLDAEGKPVPFAPDDEMLLSAFAAQAGVSIQNAQLDEKLRRSHQETLFRLSGAAEYRDKETSNHIRRMSHYARIIATGMGLSRLEVANIHHSAPMHDVGKLGIPDRILHKPGPLTPEERTIMESHCLIGARILEGSDVPVVHQASVLALTHHEKWDGTGYPQKLSGRRIPLEGRIAAVADVFDALASRRCYKEAWPEDKVLEYLVEQKGKHFDPDLVDCFLQNMDEVRRIQALHLDTDEDFQRIETLSTHLANEAVDQAA
ncbi:MAG: GAF domain-containing protein [Fibrobacteres bacterium]|nr:GAF domain-containing protein [Fibrobacterota bacterium]